MSKFAIVLLGEPASGKATQSLFLSKKYKLYDLDMGKLLRLNFKRLPKKIRDHIGKGNLAPTSLVKNILTKELQKLPKTKGVILDGTPKMLGEARVLNKILKQEKFPSPLVLYLTVPKNESLKRMQLRKEKQGKKIIIRADDNAKALANRISYYKKNVAEVVKFYKKTHQFKTINGLGTKQQVHARIIAVVKKYLDEQKVN